MEDLATKPIGVKRSTAFDLDLAIVLVLLVGLNLPYLSDRIIPLHDTFYNFANFHIFYSEFFFHGDLARWYPYGTYGLQSDYEQIISLSPACYLVGLVGKLLQISDALFLFKLAAIGDQIAFVLGIHLLSGRLFATRATRLVLTVAAAASSVWYMQQWWDLRIYYLLPLVLYFFATFLESRRPEQLWLAGITGVAGCVGFLVYVIPIWLVVLLLIGLIATAGRYRDTFALLFTPSRANLGTLAVFLAVASIYLYFVLNALDHTILRAPDRDPLTGKVTLEDFLLHGGEANLATVASAMLFGWPLQLPWGSGSDNSVYIGLLPLVGFAIALARERSRMFYSLTGAALFLVWLSYGGVFTHFIYNVPGLSYYRHISLVYGLVKVLILIASGYGLERLWALATPRFKSPVLIVITAVLLVEAVAGLASLSGRVDPDWSKTWGSHVLLRLAVYGACLALSRALAISWKGALTVGLAFDLMLFQFAIYQTQVSKLPLRDRGLLEAVRVREPYYQPDRRERPTVPASQAAFDLTTRQSGSGMYWYVYQYSNFDPCHSEYRTDILPIGVDGLLSLERRAGVDASRILGCGVPKLQLVSEARIVDTFQDAQRALVAEARSGERTPVIRLAAGTPPPPAAGDRQNPADRVELTDFTLGELRANVHVETPTGGWLIYTDANHPDWRAYVNGEETPIHEANLAFKAVRVPPGASEVHFSFRHGINYFLSYAIALFGVAAALGLIALLVATSFRLPRPTDSGTSHPDARPANPPPTTTD